MGILLINDLSLLSRSFPGRNFSLSAISEERAVSLVQDAISSIDRSQVGWDHQLFDSLSNVDMFERYGWSPILSVSSESIADYGSHSRILCPVPNGEEFSWYEIVIE